MKLIPRKRKFDMALRDQGLHLFCAAFGARHIGFGPANRPSPNRGQPLPNLQTEPRQAGAATGMQTLPWRMALVIPDSPQGISRFCSIKTEWMTRNTRIDTAS